MEPNICEPFLDPVNVLAPLILVKSLSITPTPIIPSMKLSLSKGLVDKLISLYFHYLH